MSKIKIKKKINTYPNGGRQPIYVNDKNDPRLQAYSDSLDLYNMGQISKNNLKNLSQKYNQPQLNTEWDKWLNSPNGIKNNQSGVNAALRLDNYNNSFPQNSGGLRIGNSVANTFTKPVQPILYNPNTTTEDKRVPQNNNGTMNVVESNKTPWGARMTDIPKGRNESDYRIETYSYNGNGLWTYVLNEQPKLRPKENVLTLNQEQQYLPQKEQHLEFDPIGLKKGTYFTRPRQQQEAGQGKMDYFDNKTGKLLKTMEFGGKTPKYEWSKGIDNIQPITQTQNNSSITTGNKKLSTEELKKAAEYTKKYNQQHLEEEYNNRQNKLKQSIDAQKQPLSLKNLQTQTQSTGDKLSLAMNSKYGNPKDYPTLSGYIQGLDYINPFKMIGDMASGLGSAPQDVNEGNYLKAGLSVASPLAVGAMAGVGANSVKPFVNNLVNPLAGTGKAFSNLYKEQIYKAFEPVGYGAKEKILNSPKTWVRNTFIKSPEERAKHIGSQLSNNENLFEEVGKNRLDAWRTGLGLNQKWDTFEKIGENSYRIKNMKPSVGEFSSIYNDLNANELNKMGYYSGENPLIGLTEKHEKVTSPKIQTEYGLTDINDIRKYLRKGDKVAPWEQYRIVEPSKNKDFSHSVYDTDKQGIMGSFRWDINKPSYPDYNIHYQSNDTWDLNPFENRGATQLKNNPELSKFHFKPLENLEALKLVGGKPFNIQNNFLVDPKTYEIKKSFKNGGNITRENEWELVNETNKKLPKRRLNLNKSSDWEIVD